VSLNRPSKKNAMNQALTLELEQLLGVLNASPNDTRVVVFRGSNENFSAGDDIGDIPEDPREAEQLSLRRGALYQAITMSPQVFVAEVDGLCLGGGLVLASACDFRISSQRASFGLPEVTLGWPPNYGMGIVLSLMGRAAAMELALTGRRLNARDAASLGLVNELVPHTQLSEFAQQYATKMLQLPSEAIKEIKKLLAPGEVWSDQTATQAFIRCLKTDTAIENLRRFRPSS
ncbi:MAG: enoyl-CoA hydratase/isomerase family protein, partial [Planctomycetota bacterium]|nr:enoyl-CoA hydratase/isomerase family protein [Planctomycetota bacterium]